MAKTKADDLNKISIWKLSSSELFKSSGLWADISNDDGIFAYISFREGYKKYIIIKFPNSSIMQNVYITSTPCLIGGKRFWFLCPDCNKRVGVLYLSELGYFSCRVCLDLSYKSKNKNYRKKSYIFLKPLDNYLKANALFEKTKRLTYAGQATKTMQKVAKLYRDSIFSE